MRRATNKVSAYLEDHVLESLEAYAKQSGKSKSLVVNDAVYAALVGRHTESAKTVLEHRLDSLQGQLAQHDRVLLEAVRMTQEMLGLFVRTYLNDTPPLDTKQRAQAAASGRKRFGRFLAVVNESLGPGRSILDEQVASENQREDHDG